MRNCGRDSLWSGFRGNIWRVLRITFSSSGGYYPPIRDRFGLRLFYLPAPATLFTSHVTKTPPHLMRGLLLPDEDSNLDKQNQNLSYCLYTIGQNTINSNT